MVCPQVLPHLDKESLPMLQSAILTMTHREALSVSRLANGVIFHVEWLDRAAGISVRAATPDTPKSDLKHKAASVVDVICLDWSGVADVPAVSRLSTDRQQQIDRLDDRLYCHHCDFGGDQ